MNRVVFAALLASCAILPAFADVRIPYRANIRGGSGRGKCTIEVQVDNAATVEINGVEGVLISPRGNLRLLAPLRMQSAPAPQPV